MIDVKKAFESRTTKIILSSVACVLVVLIVFSVGMFVGFRKANFSYRWGENYSRNFGGPRMGMMGGFAGRDFTPGYGVVGSILKIDGSTLIVKSKDNAEKAVLTDEKTSIVRGREKILISDVTVDDTVVIIGEPNESGQIVAKLIRLMPVLNADDEADYGRDMMRFGR